MLTITNEPGDARFELPPGVPYDEAHRLHEEAVEGAIARGEQALMARVRRGATEDEIVDAGILLVGVLHLGGRDHGFDVPNERDRARWKKAVVWQRAFYDIPNRLEGWSCSIEVEGKVEGGAARPTRIEALARTVATIAYQCARASYYAQRRARVLGSALELAVPG